MPIAIIFQHGKVLSDENIKPPAASNDSLAPVLNDISCKSPLKFDGSYLKQDKSGIFHKKVVNIYIVRAPHLWLFNVGKDFALRDSLIQALKVTENIDPDKYKYSG